MVSSCETKVDDLLIAGQQDHDPNKIWLPSRFIC